MVITECTCLSQPLTWEKSSEQPITDVSFLISHLCFCFLPPKKKPKINSSIYVQKTSGNTKTWIVCRKNISLFVSSSTPLYLFGCRSIKHWLCLTSQSCHKQSPALTWAKMPVDTQTDTVKHINGSVLLSSASLLLLHRLFCGQDSNNNGYNGYRIGVWLIHKDEVIYRLPLMLCPTESPLAVDYETCLNGVISHWHFVRLNELLYQRW